MKERDGTLAVAESRVRDRESSESATPVFLDRTADVHLDFTHTPYKEIAKDTPVVPGLYLGSGASAGDFDGDGWLDLIVGDGVQTRLLHNKGDGTFEDVTESAGLGKIGS